MLETKTFNPEETLICGLCRTSCDASLIVMRGKLNFCRLCVNSHPEECLKRLRGKRGGKMLATLAMAVICCGVGFGASRFGEISGLWKHSNSPGSKNQESAVSSSGAGSQTAQRLTAVPAESAASEALPITETHEDKTASTMWPSLSSVAGSLKKMTSFGPKSVVDIGNLHLLFVIRPGTDGAMGLASRLYATKESPNKEAPAKLMTEVGHDMESSFEEGLRYVRKQPRDWEKDFSIRLSFEDKFSSKDGGSAATGFTLEMLAAINDIALDPDLAITGDLTIDGEVQPVGAVVEKLRGSIAGKCKITLIPERNTRSVQDMALLDGTSPLWETQIFSIKNVDEALSLARMDRPEKIRSAIARFDQLRARLPAEVTPNYLLSPIVQAELKEVLRLAPNHLSAATLLSAAVGQTPKELSLNRSVDEIIAASYLFVADIVATEDESSYNSSAGKTNGPGITLFPDREYAACVKKLTNLQPMLDRRSLELKAACLSYASTTRTLWSYRTGGASYTPGRPNYAVVVRDVEFQRQTMEAHNSARSRVIMLLRELSMNGSLIKELTKK